MIIDCISDLHGFIPTGLDKGDLLIVSGDLTARDFPEEHFAMWDWLCDQNYKMIIIVAGNHDNFIQSQEGRKLIENWSPNLKYLYDSSAEFEGLKIWGTPWTKTFEGMNPDCKAFTVDTEPELMRQFEGIPVDTDILITHSPSVGILDKTSDGINAGSSALCMCLHFVLRPKIHVFGHIHEGYGQIEILLTYQNKMMRSINASVVDEHYKPVNKPIRVEL